jgi:hypothetical protein
MPPGTGSTFYSGTVAITRVARGRVALRRRRLGERLIANLAFDKTPSQRWWLLSAVLRIRFCFALVLSSVRSAFRSPRAEIQLAGFCALSNV